jgi:hypothetical protein
MDVYGGDIELVRWVCKPTHINGGTFLAIY